MISQHNRATLTVSRFPGAAACAVTTSWDDNDERNVEIARMLDSMNLSGTFYVDPGNPHGHEMTDGQLQMLAARHEIGSHTWSHKNMQQCGREELREELTTSKAYIERVTGRTVLGLAYPWGEYSPLAQHVASECGYIFARTVDEGWISFPPLNPYAWGVSVHAMTKPRILSKKALLYLKHRSNNWVVVAQKLFTAARKANAVWHLFGHAFEILGLPDVGQEFLDVGRFVANKPDVWYTTNGALFLNETIKNHTRIVGHHLQDRSIFEITTSAIADELFQRVPIPLRFSAPGTLNRDLHVEVTVPDSQRYEVGVNSNGLGWVNVFGGKATIEIRKI